ncbi:class I SAM-dependent methyltransferase [Spirosoma endophyticum]|uniref:Methyltransferase domain-containing protein n=1 Tax=Spirosoma endophyticum TaxID=662367 RepID=A0A1I1W2K9_9BACT|nr:class I SAM-dependent methyltransferase [Spirosoma endophyticum]SFD87180.1 Methyltransferase domain-containing protein [Spirosoma endophyticum]
MQLRDAIALIQHDERYPARPSTWADLGCGTGLFTRALASLLQPGSLIYGIDMNKASLSTVSKYEDVTIQPVCQDFIRDEWPFERIDGLLMANSLHYVQDKRTLIDKIQGYLVESGSLLLVEYDTDVANPWVPYPLSYYTLANLFKKAGFTSIEKLQEMPSRYGSANLYATYIRR